MSHIVVPLDGSVLARQAIPLALALARTTGATLKLVEAQIPPASVEVALEVDTILDGLSAGLEEEAERIRETYGLAVLTHTALGFPAQVILEEASGGRATAVVMSTHGRTGLLRLARGSVAESVLRYAPVPVYFVPAAAGPRADFPNLKRILVPLDGSDLSHAVIGPVVQLAHEAGAGLTLLRVVEPHELPPGDDAARQLTPADDLELKLFTYFGNLKARIRQAGVSVTSRWTVGEPAMEILALAAEVGAGLIALSTHGRSGIDRVRHGSVAEEVLRHSTRPVMTFGPKAVRRLAGGVSVQAEDSSRQLLSI